MATTKRTGERESSFCNRSQSDNLLSAIFRQKQQRKFCDVLIKVCGREIGAHSNVLAAVSPYFAAFFGQDLPRCFSQKCPQLIEIQIDGFTGSDAVYETAVDSVITYAYTGVIWVSDSSVTQVLEIARTMQLDDVVLFCEDFISNHKVSSNQFMKLSDIVQSSGDDESNAIFADKVKTEETTPHRPFLSSSSNVYQGLGCGGSSRSRSMKMNSVSTQVRPALLGMQSCLGEMKDQSTSTDVRLFWNFEKHRRVGKRELKPIGSCFDGDAESTLNENEHSVNLLTFDSADSDSVKNDDNSVRTQFTTESENSDLSINNKGIRKVSNMVQDVCDRQQLLKIRYSSRTRRRPLKLLDGEVDLEHNIKFSNKNVDILAASCHEQKRVELQEEIMQQSESNVNNNILPSEIILDSSTGNSIDLFKSSPAKEKKKLGFSSRASEWKKFCCDLCSFSTNNVRSMSAHNKLHKMLDNVCYYCELKFQDRKSMELHMLEHTSQTMPFFCRFCHQHFQSRTQLMLHLPKHSDEKPYICEVCSIGFKWKNALKNHMITHENRKEHLCDICGYATAHRCQLKAHRLVHTGETMQCPHDGCNYHATKAQNLKYHMLTHTQVKAHQCEVCGTSFSLVKNLKRHMLLHTSQKSHKCECCEFASTRYDKLKEHLHKQHSIGTAPEKRMRITDMVYQSRISENPSSQRSGNNNDTAEFKPSLGVDPVVESSDMKSDLEVFYSDDYQMLELADGFRVDEVRDVKDAIRMFPNQTIIIAHANDVSDLAIQSQLPGVTLLPVVSLAHNALGDSSGEVNSNENVILDCIEHAACC